MLDNVRVDYETHGRTLRSAGFWALLVYRFGVWSDGLRFRPLRWLTTAIYIVWNAFIAAATGIMIERRTQIGKGFHIIHPGMLQIHPNTVIGDRVGIMHNVTLGTNMSTECPTIGDDVFIGCGASVLGGVTVGEGARISANTLVIADVPPGAVAMGVPAQIYPNMERLRSRKRKPKKPRARKPAADSGLAPEPDSQTLPAGASDAEAQDA